MNPDAEPLNLTREESIRLACHLAERGHTDAARLVLVEVVKTVLVEVTA